MALLHRYAGEDQIRIGLSGAGVQHDQGGWTPEPFQPDLILHVDLAGQPNVGELLKRMWMTIRAERDREGPELAAVAGEPFGPDGDRDDPPQAMIRFDRSAAVRLPIRHDGSTDVTGRPAAIDLCLEVEEVPPQSGPADGPAGVVGRVLYNSELFEPRSDRAAD